MSATDGIDGRWVFVGCSLLAAGSSFAFAGCADGFWTALLLRFLNGVALAGVHMPGLKLLVGTASQAGHEHAAPRSTPRHMPSAPPPHFWSPGLSTRYFAGA